MEPLSKVFNCLTCGTETIKRKSDHRFCSTSCRSKHNNAHTRTYRTDWQRENSRKNRKTLADYKLERGCCKCGYNAHSAALDFNHLDPALKSFNIAEMVTSLSLPKLMEEVQKCEILCANCHRIHTYEQKHYTHSNTRLDKTGA
jgi:hypothetical protein